MSLGVLLWCLSSLEYVGSPNIRSRLLLRKIQKESLKILEADLEDCTTGAFLPFCAVLSQFHFFVDGVFVNKLVGMTPKVRWAALEAGSKW